MAVYGVGRGLKALVGSCLLSGPCQKFPKVPAQCEKDMFVSYLKPQLVLSSPTLSPSQRCPNSDL